MSFIKELMKFMKTRKKYWIIPVVLTVLLIGGLLVLSSGTAVAPFIYTLF